MVLEGGRDLMILKGMLGCIHSKTQVIVSKEWQAEEGRHQGAGLGTEWAGQWRGVGAAVGRKWVRRKQCGRDAETPRMEARRASDVEKRGSTKRFSLVFAAFHCFALRVCKNREEPPEPASRHSVTP